jgi:predicted nucleic acid-binding protein
MAISAITLAELSAGPHQVRPNGEQDLYDEHEERARRTETLQRAESEFDPVPFDAEAARVYGRVTAVVVAAGRKPRRRIADLMIAATAIAEDLTLFTTNPGDYAGLEKLMRLVPVTRPPLPHENKPHPRELAIERSYPPTPDGREQRPGYHTKNPFFRYWFRYVADNRSRLARHRTTGKFPPSLHFTASGSTGLPSFTAGRIFYPNLYPCRPSTRNCRRCIPCGNGLSLTSACGLRVNLPSWSCGFDSRHPLSQLIVIFRNRERLNFGDQLPGRVTSQAGGQVPSESPR